MEPECPDLLPLYSNTDSSDSGEEKEIIFNVDQLQYDCNNYHFNSLSKSKTNEIQENSILRLNGYSKLETICDTLQGELLLAQVNKPSLGLDTPIGSYVVIKKANKHLLSQKVGNKNGMIFSVDQDLKKEALILKQLTFDNKFPGNFVIKYLDSFESNTDFYLVMEHIESKITLKQFIKTAHKYLKNGTLLLKEYSKAIKYLMWQLAATIRCLHSVFHCCHLNLFSGMVTLINADFIAQANGMFKVSSNISIKVQDFGVSEIFDMNNNNTFQCNKFALTLDNWSSLSPQILNNSNKNQSLKSKCFDSLLLNSSYDARSADCWSFGVMLYECMIGEPFYEWIVLKNFTLKKYLETINFVKYFTNNSLSLLSNLLTVDSNNRYNAKQIMEHLWFQKYYKQYQHVIDTYYS